MGVSEGMVAGVSDGFGEGCEHRCRCERGCGSSAVMGVGTRVCIGEHVGDDCNSVHVGVDASVVLCVCGGCRWCGYACEGVRVRVVVGKGGSVDALPPLPTTTVVGKGGSATPTMNVMVGVAGSKVAHLAESNQSFFPYSASVGSELT